VDANGGRWSSLFDARGSERATQDPLGALHTYQFDAVGNRIHRLDARQWPTTCSFDALDRESVRLYRDSSRVTWGYDSAGRLVLMADETGNADYTVDALDRQSVVAYPWGHRLSYEFDPVSNRTLLRAPDGVTTYGWSPENLVELVWNPYNERTTIVWDPLSRESHRTLANGTTAKHTFDSVGRETLLEWRRSSGEAIAVYTAGYDSVSNRLWVHELDGSRVTYTHDASYQLTREQRSLSWPYDIEYGYDRIGSRLLKVQDSQRYTSQFNAAQELLLIQNPGSIAPTTFTWDQNGNLEIETAGTAITTSTWDSENRLTRVQSSTDTEVMQYAVDEKRLSRQTGLGISRFTWDGENLLLESDSLLTLLARYSDYPGFWGGLVSQRRSGTSSYYASDLQGSTRALLSAAEALTDEYCFTAFGEEAGAHGGTVNPVRYVGEYGYYQDLSTRLFVRARHLKPAQGSWISRDPIPGVTSYRYAGNSPTTNHDPTGMIDHPCVLRTKDYYGWANRERGQRGNNADWHWGQACMAWASDLICNWIGRLWDWTWLPYLLPPAPHVLILWAACFNMQNCSTWLDCVNKCVYECWSNPAKCDPRSKGCWTRAKAICRRSAPNSKACCSAWAACDQGRISYCLQSGQCLGYPYISAPNCMAALHVMVGHPFLEGEPARVNFFIKTCCVDQDWRGDPKLY